MIKTLLGEVAVAEVTAAWPELSEAQLVDEYGDSVYKFCRSITYTSDDADDLYQDTFLKAFSQMQKIGEAENRQSFLLSTAAYLWKSRRRKYARRNRLAPETSIDGDADIGIVKESVENGFLATEERDMVRGLVDALPEKLKIPVVLHYTSELRVAEIASILKIPTGTVMSRLYKARKIIEKGLVSKYGY